MRLSLTPTTASATRERSWRWWQHDNFDGVDAEGRQTQVKTVVGARTDKVNYEYNALGQLVRTYTGDVVAIGSSTNGDGKAVTDTRYAYDQLGRLIQVSLVERNDTVLGTAETTKYYFDAVGNLKDEVEANGVVADYTYDGLNRLTTLVHFVDSDHDLVVDSGESVLAKFVYTLNSDGSRATETDFTDATANVAMSYAWLYDGLGRLTKETYANTGDSTANYTDSYTFDMAGSGSTTVTTYGYDSTGNRITQTLGTGSAPTTVINYTVDANNPTGYSQTLEERTTIGGTTTTKTYTLGLDVIAQYDTNSTAGTMTFLYDGHGSTRDFVGVAGSTVTVFQVYAYEAFGDRISASNLTSLGTTAWTSLLYSGEQTDKSGMLYLRARYYNTSAGRFISFDSYAGNTIDPQSLHKYLYADGNSINQTDPTGRFSIVEFATQFSISDELDAEEDTAAEAEKRAIKTKVFDVYFGIEKSGVSQGSVPAKIQMIGNLIFVNDRAMIRGWRVWEAGETSETSNRPSTTASDFLNLLLRPAKHRFGPPLRPQGPPMESYGAIYPEPGPM